MSLTNPQPPQRLPATDTQLWLDRGYSITAAGNGWVTLRRPKKFSVLAFLFTLWVPYLIYYALKRDDIVTIAGRDVRHNGKKIQGPTTVGTKIVGLIIVLAVTLALTAATGSALVLVFGLLVFVTGLVSKTEKKGEKVVRSKHSQD